MLNTLKLQALILLVLAQNAHARDCADPIRYPTHDVHAVVSAIGIFSTSRPSGDADRLAAQYIHSSFLYGRIQITFESMQLQNRWLAQAILTGAVFANSNLDSSVLTRAHLCKANLMNANLSNTKLQNTNFTDANLAGADLINVKTHMTIFKNANLRNANVTNADFKNSSFINATLIELNAENTDWSNSNLAGADVSLSDFRNALGLTQEQVDEACYQTALGAPLLPGALNIPPECE